MDSCRTRIVCTLGPASRSLETLEQLVQNGLSVARLNFSHGTREEHAAAIADLREVSEKLERPVAILQDLAGFKVRIGEMAGGSAQLQPGSLFTLAPGDRPGDAQGASVSYPDLARDLRPGDTLLLSDGAIELEVEALEGDAVQCRVVVGGPLSSRKGVVAAGRAVGQSGLTDKDRKDLRFGIEQGVDLVALSFLRRPADVEQARRLVSDLGARTPLIAKIENQEAMDSIDGILEAADGIMVARGDLGVGVPVARIPRLQKTLIQKANRAGKPVITATHMLRSMVDSPRPTRAEVTDVANSILDGTDAVMLSEETAVGSHPVAAVRTMAEVAREAEASFPYDSWLRRFRRAGHESVADAIAFAVCTLAEDVAAAAILCCTSSGSTARSVAKFRPRRPILALTPRPATLRELSLVWGVLACQGPPTTSTDDLIASALEAACRRGLLAPGDRAVVTAGVPAGTPGNTNLIKVETVS
jgi:pyruvate kinase